MICSVHVIRFCESASGRTGENCDVEMLPLNFRQITRMIRRVLVLGVVHSHTPDRKDAEPSKGTASLFSFCYVFALFTTDTQTISENAAYLFSVKAPSIDERTRVIHS